LILIVVGIEFFINSFKRFLNPVPISGDLVVILVLILSIGAKELLASISFNLGERINSASLRADAWHHRTDSIATALVVLGFILFRFGLYRVDGVIGMAVSVLIAFTGVSIIREAGSFLVGEAPDSTLLERIKNAAAGFDDIVDVHHIHVHDYAGQLEVTIHVRLKGDTHLAEAHQTASEVEEAIRKRVPGAEVTVHVEPITKDERTE
jgi:cation diffusion facilitator family transporter